ncbi:ATP-binding cassette domain-containing protein [Dyella jiangningensis]|uniref:ABC transporter ATP-binding protein n=1 Tax=Dyella jiangningensis TaxID=1379159 RepID=A0A328P8L9_9GAMM|nr:ABC transporter ATP-binding protein [Dyella jiangningensis]RAO77631.1 ABC transporter ATP-binding protein [Dyella jiangningensis]
MAVHPARANDRAHDTWHLVWASLTRADVTGLVVYVVLSLAAALAGGIAAVALVPLIQPDHVWPIAARISGMEGGMAMRVAVFAVAMGSFAWLRWQAARCGARQISAYGMRLRRQVHARLIDASLGSLADATSAEIAHVLTHNVEVIVQGLSALQQLLLAGLTCAVSLGLALWVSPPLAFAAPLLAGVGLLASRLFGREQSEVARQYVADMTRLFWHSEDFPRRLRHVRSFGREDAEKAGYADVSARLGHGYRRQLELVASGRLVLELLAALGISGIFLFAQRWRGVDQASVIAVCLLLGRLLPYLVSTRQSFQQLRSAGPALELRERYMRMPPALASTSATPTGERRDALHVERMNVVPPMPGILVEHLPLIPGEMTLISGDSGIGKSSLVDALAGMAAPQGFKARAGGHDIDFDDYRQRVRNSAYVSQSVRPWQRTVRECLHWADPHASDEVLHGVLKDVGLDLRLSTSRQGLDTDLHSSSSRLSGGELQRLLLAQVILRQPYIALLDEATSALDTASELRVLAALKARLPHTVLIVVSHRLGVAALAEQQLDIGGGQSAALTRRTSREQEPSGRRTMHS